MMEATIVVLPKEGKDLLQPCSYRLISLHCADVKLLAPVIATRLSKGIQSVVHPDQSGFILDRSTSLNVK